MRASAWQTQFGALTLLPLIALILWLSRIAFNAGSTTASIAILFAGIALSIYLQRYLPTVHGPARGREQARSRCLG